MCTLCIKFNGELKMPKLIIIDEAHHLVGDTCEQQLSSFPHIDCAISPDAVIEWKEKKPEEIAVAHKIHIPKMEEGVK